MTILSVSQSSGLDRRAVLAINQLIAKTDNIVTATAATVLDEKIDFLLCDATSAAFTVTLPKASPYKGRKFTIKKTDASANAVTIDGDGAETIDGAATASLSAQHQWRTVESDGTEWRVIASNSSGGGGGGLSDGDYGDIVVSGSGTVLSFDTGVVTAFAKTFLDDPDAATVRTTIGAQASGSYQASDGDLTALAALSGTNTIYYRSAADTWTAVTIGGGLSFSGGTLNSNRYAASPTAVPDLSTFTTWRNQGSATITADSYGVYFAGDNDGELHIYETNLPSTPFSYYAKIRQEIFSTAANTAQIVNQAGFTIVNSTSGRAITFELGWERVSGDENLDYYYQIERFSNVTTFNTTVSSWRQIAPPEWLRVDVTSTNATIYGSIDGRRWTSLGSETFATFLTATGGTADKFGIYHRCGSNATSSRFYFDVLQATAPA